MVLNIRQKQIDAVVRMLHFNAASGPGSGPSSAGSVHSQQQQQNGRDETYKVLVLDSFTKDIIAPLLKVAELRRHGVTLTLSLERPREPIPDVPAVYFLTATEGNIAAVVADASAGMYDSLHLNFAFSVPRPLMEKLAASSVRQQCQQRIAKVHDQFLAFRALEAGLFSLGLPNVYVDLNAPGVQDHQVQACINSVVDGLFSAVATLGVVPIIKCPKSGAAEHIGRELDTRLRDHLRQRSNLFAEGTGGLGASLSRPLLCLFERNFELSVALQHTWTYKPLVHDVLGLHLNSLTIEAPAGQQLMPQESRRRYDVGDGDFFWEQHGRDQFPKAAADSDLELNKYKAEVQDLNRQTGASMDPDIDPSSQMQSNTRHLMSAVTRLPQLSERKRIIDKHTNILHALLAAIQGRTLDKFYTAEEACLLGKGDVGGVVNLLQTSRGTPTDALRLALVLLLTCEALPAATDLERLAQALQQRGADLAAFNYVRRMRSLNLTGKAAAQPGVDGLGGGSSSQSQLLTWADKAFGQGLNAVTKGVKNLIAGEQRAAVTSAVESLMEAKATPENDAYVSLDPKAPLNGTSRVVGPFKEAIVFMVGGGNYLEYESLSGWASRAQPPRSIVYGATELLTGEQFLQQLATLGQQT
eukprot:jgi/Astpho2/4186/fgenesh1_pg.00064_%23_12_t